MSTTRWSVERANKWYAELPWLCGYNFLPSTAVNFCEMWQTATFDPETIDRELGWARAIGMNTLRTNLNIAAWREDSAGLVERIDQFLAIAAKHEQRVMLCHFDDCAFSGLQPYAGPQRPPLPGVHNSGCTPSPGHEVVLNPDRWPEAQAFLEETMRPFVRDERIFVWDLYNEPGNGAGLKLCDMSLPFLQACFPWARALSPVQPITSGWWAPFTPGVNEFVLAQSDIITFHCYSNEEKLRQRIADLGAEGRPLLCTEWMARTTESRFETLLPVLRELNVGCYCWGLVQGKTQTHLPWGWSEEQGEPDEWHHDIFHPDGTPYRASEVDAIRAVMGAE